MTAFADLLARDEKCLWHPYTQHGAALPTLAVEGASGAYLHCAGGRKLLDAISSWWVNLHGHAHPQIVRAIAEQAAQLEHVIFSGFTHEPAVRLAEILTDACAQRGAPLAKVFYSDNGSTAVEVALKMAFQYQAQRGASSRKRFIALTNAYHGDTLGAMAVGGLDGFNRVFRPLLASVDYVPAGDADILNRTLGDGSTHVAMIIEPLIQGVGGMKMHSPDYLRAAARLCRERGVLLICDEVFTGFYRTGTLFAFEQAGIAPDLLCLSKGLTGGFLPLAATLASQEIFQAFVSDDFSRAFLHGHSYTANPLGCAAALASWELLQKPGCQNRIAAIARQTKEHIARLKEHPAVAEARCLGTIGAVELKGGQGYFSEGRKKIYEAALKRGVLLRPLGNVLYTLPPYCVSDEEVTFIYNTMREVIDECLNN